MIEILDAKFGTATPIVVNHPNEGMIQLRCFGKYSYKSVPGMPEELIREHVISVVTMFIQTNIINYSITEFPMILVNSVPNIIAAINQNVTGLGAELISLNVEAINKI